MTKEEKAAQAAANTEQQGNGSETTVITAGLRKPTVTNFIGTIVGLSERAKGGKFKHDTKIITLEDVKSGEYVDIFITNKQWIEYNCAESCYLDNVVNVAVEECVEGVTGYIAEDGDTELTAHEGTYKAFNRILNATVQSLAIALSKMGVDFQTVQMLITSVSAVRSTHARAKSGSTGLSFLG